MNRIELLFFELLQVAIANRRHLSEVPSVADWHLLFEMAKKQALTAVAFQGVSRLKAAAAESDKFGGGIGIDEITYLEWLGLTAKVAQRNKIMNEACSRLSLHFLSKNIRSCILKGQGLTYYYPEELKECRNPGDIDVWTDLSRSDAKSLVKGITKDVEISLHHADYPLQGYPEIELHFMPSYLINPIANNRLQRWMISNIDAMMGNRIVLKEKHECCAPTSEFNIVFLLTHMYRHFLYEGIGLRQFLDYYYVLRAFHIEQKKMHDLTLSKGQWADGQGRVVSSNKEIMYLIKRLHLSKFTSAVMWVMKSVFSMPDVYLICDPNEKEGLFLLNEVLRMGNFGKQDEELQEIANIKNPLIRYYRKKKLSMRLFLHYPSELLWSIPHTIFYKWKTCF